MMIIENQFTIGQTVYLITDKDQSARIVIGIMLRPSGILYELGCGGAGSWHYEIEVTEDKNILAVN